MFNRYVDKKKLFGPDKNTVHFRLDILIRINNLYANVFFIAFYMISLHANCTAKHDNSFQFILHYYYYYKLLLLKLNANSVKLKML